MRFILAAVAFVASVAMLITGAVQYSQASNVSEVSAIGSTESTAPITLIGSETLASRAGTQSIVIQADGPINVAVGRTEDVTAWVGDALHNTVTIDETADTRNQQTLALVFTESGTEPTVPSVLGQDLWFEEHSGDGTLSLDLVVSPGYSMIIAADGTDPAPSDIQISWPFGGYAPLVGPLLTAGAILLLVALALLAWALMHRRSTKREAALAAKRAAASDKAVAAGDVAMTEAEWSPVPWVDAADDAGAPDDTTKRRRKAHLAVPDAESGTPPVDETDAAAPSTEGDSTPAGETAAEVTEPGETTEAGEVTEATEAAEAIESPVATTQPGEPEASPFAPPAVASPTETEPEPAAATATEPEPEPEPVTETKPEPEPVTETEPEPEPVAELEPEPVAEPADASSPSEDTKWRRPRGRNRSSAPKRQFFLAPVMAVAALTLAGCAPQYWPAEWTNADIAPTGTPTSTVEAALIEEGAMPPTLNEAQLADVVADAANLAAEADDAMDASILERRFTGDALQYRTALYEAQKIDGELAGPIPFPAGEIVYAIPEATDAWPRVVFAVVSPGEGADASVSPAAIMLVQEDARSNFKIASLTELAAGISLPEAAPVSVGAPSIANLEGPLVMDPAEIAPAYADIISKGDKSEFASKFDATNDTLRAQVNDAYRKGLSDELDPEVVTISFAYAASKTAPIGITSIDGGAIVAVSITETETLKAANDRARITVTGRTAVLSGVETSATGFDRTYTDQLLFYVPSAETGGPIQFLGVSQAMTDAKELPEES
ncbi:hypothetical protein [Gulosibacter molinativorax]|uniref:DUF8094 domain-containing protein n=1 Tax=Gulosibacter molinativorax TaxID=256821 RepID=A0ABT7CBV5_9MICO|nr:hypothetical protein [Gulosibacter molinativorax]MDJ1372647.1 hypothetical protein [Gulosibacter molinativorax]QUY60765.1 Hypotetical protein [Gulosibacter molinativorax]